MIHLYTGDGDLDLVVGNDLGNLAFYINNICFTTCNNHGLCDGSYGATCSCLSGYAGDQCNACQTGYFGGSCDLCPEGGDETKDAPRVTDCVWTLIPRRASRGAYLFCGSRN